MLWHRSECLLAARPPACPPSSQLACFTAFDQHGLSSSSSSSSSSYLPVTPCSLLAGRAGTWTERGGKGANVCQAVAGRHLAAVCGGWRGRQGLPLLCWHGLIPLPCRAMLHPSIHPSAYLREYVYNPPRPPSLPPFLLVIQVQIANKDFFLPPSAAPSLPLLRSWPTSFCASGGNGVCYRRCRLAGKRQEIRDR